MYSVLFDDGEGKLTAKGIPKTYKKQNMRHEEFVHVLREKDASKKATFRRIKARNHRLQTVQITKISLSPYDCKRFILPCGIKTHAFGHKAIPKA